MRTLRGGNLVAKSIRNFFTPRVRLFTAIATVGIILDQWSKYLAVKHLTTAMEGGGVDMTFGERLHAFLWTTHPAPSNMVTVLDDFWRFRYVENPGAAWGFLAGFDSSIVQPFFLVVSVAAMAFIIHMFRRTAPEQRILRIGLAMVFGGAIGNVIDRARLAYVIDFIDWHWYNGPAWPTFNIADAFISVGVGFLVIDMIADGRRQSAANKQDKSSGKKDGKAVADDKKISTAKLTS